MQRHSVRICPVGRVCVPDCAGWSQRQSVYVCVRAYVCTHWLCGRNGIGQHIRTNSACFFFISSFRSCASWTRDFLLSTRIVRRRSPVEVMLGRSIRFHTLIDRVSHYWLASGKNERNKRANVYAWLPCNIISTRRLCSLTFVFWLVFLHIDHPLYSGHIALKRDL